MCHHHHEPKSVLDRRTVLKAGSAAVGVALAGCTRTSSESTESPDPVSLADGKVCDVCGMVIADHPGPNGQIFYSDHSPETHDNPAWFESLRSCMFPYYFEKQQFDWEVTTAYATDYSTVEYDLQTEDGDTYVPSFTDPETFADVDDLTFVVGSDVMGSMGADFIPFSDDGDVSAFVEEHGGEQYAFDDVTVEMLGR